jgi:hypothetical protein
MDGFDRPGELHWIPTATESEPKGDRGDKDEPEPQVDVTVRHRAERYL